MLGLAKIEKKPNVAFEDFGRINFDLIFERKVRSVVLRGTK